MENLFTKPICYLAPLKQTYFVYVYICLVDGFTVTKEVLSWNP